MASKQYKPKEDYEIPRIPASATPDQIKSASEQGMREGINMLEVFYIRCFGKEPYRLKENYNKT